MLAYASILLYAIPFFVILILLEQGIALYRGEKINRLFDVISSLSSGISNIVKDVLGLSIVIISYSYMENHWSLFSMETHWYTYLIAFVGIDFAGYWSHRFSHEINVLWNRHIIHHSSEEFNLSCALRQSISEVFAIFTILYIPLAILGVPVMVIGIVAPLQLFAQFWYHTRLIHKMGWLEKIIVTPSHHRVHHAINPEYMDKNYGQIFIFWDKWFGTFQQEKREIKPVYGVTRAVKTWNPWLINFKHLLLLWKDFFRTTSWKDKLVIWFKPTGWRPSDVVYKYPVESIKDIQHQKKYETQGSHFFQFWSTFQLLITLVFTLYFFMIFGHLSNVDIFLYGIFIFIQIFAFTSLMDGSYLGVVGEFVKIFFVTNMLYPRSFIWFGMESWNSTANVLTLSYFLVSLLLSVYFFTFDKPRAIDISENHALNSLT
ncbi:MAG: sterol desaturase family protein [Saprospiraceae bacterium]